MKRVFINSALVFITLLALTFSALGVTPAYAATVIVTKTADTNDGECITDCSLREAIATASANDTITFDAALSGAAITVGSELSITKNLTIDGSALASSVIISGGGTTRVFYIGGAATVRLNGLTITNGNTSTYAQMTGFGAGIYNSNGALTVTNSTFTNNDSYNHLGGGIANDAPGSLTVVNTTIAGNSSGIANFSGMTIINSTIYANNLSSGGAYSGYGIYSNGAIYTIKNSIVAGQQHNCYMVTNPGGNNNLSDGGCGGSLATTGTINLGALASNGGPTQTMALLAGSSALGAGNATDCAAPPVSGKDQRGFTRPQGETNCDIGAYEAPDLTAPAVSAFTVTSPATSLDASITAFTASDNVAVTGYLVTESSTAPLAGDSGWAGAIPSIYTVTSGGPHTLYPWVKDAAGYVSPVFGSPASVTVCFLSITVTSGNDSGAGTLRQAFVDACAGATITFDNDYTITLTSGELAATKSVTIDGSGHAIIIDGNKASRVLHAADAITLKSLTLKNGDAGAAQSGGGLFAAMDATLDSVSIVDNKTAEEGGGALIDGIATVSNSTFSGNKTTDATSGNADGGALRVNGDMTVTDSYFANNTAANSGGAITGGTGATSISGSTFSGNSAVTGGAIKITNTTTITNSTFYGNTSNTNGGALVLGGATTLTNDTIAYSSNVGIQGAGPVSMTNTIIAYTVTGADCSATMGTNANNLTEDNTCSPALSGNPKLGALANNGGTTKTMALLSGSPAINAGNNGTCISTDQRGLARPQGATCDMGAHEATIATIALVNPSPTNAATVQFTVNFSSAVTGVDAADFKLTNMLITGASITGVTGSGTGPYTVTANTGTGNGSLRLDVIGKGAYIGTSAAATYMVDKGNAPTVPVLKTPLTNALVTTSPALDWGDSSEVMALANPWSYEVNIAALDGYNHTFNTVSGLSNSSLGDFSAAPLSPNTTYTWKVRSCNDTNQCSAWSLTRTFRTKLATPVLNLPADSTTENNKRPTFEWDSVSGATSYTLQIFKKSAIAPYPFTVLVHTSPLIAAPAYAYTPAIDLLPSTQYQWKVKANGLNQGDYSAPFSFTTSANPPKTPVQSLPATGTSILSSATGTELKWVAVIPVVNVNLALAYPAAASYDVQVSTNAGFANLSPSNNVKTLNVGGTITTLLAVLNTGTAPDNVIRPGRTYYWRVRSISAAGNHSAWSAARTILVKFVAPTLVAPADLATGVSRTAPTFTWSSGDNGIWTSYTIQLATTPPTATTFSVVKSFTLIMAPKQTYTAALTALTQLKPSQKYYWRVQILGLYTPIFSTQNFLTSWSFTTAP